MRETIVLSFSIVRAGSTDEYNTIGLAASVVDKNYNQIDSFEAGCYFEECNDTLSTIFDAQYKETFWRDKQGLLNRLKYEGGYNPFMQEGKMICAFMKFISDWEKHAKDTGLTLEVATDNPAYNAGFVNIMISEHTDIYPLPFTTDGQPRILLDTISQQKGVLSTMCKFSIDPTKHNYSRIITDVYSINNLPAYTSVDYLLDRAYNIALDQQILNNIRNCALAPNSQIVGELNKTLAQEFELELKAHDAKLAELAKLTESSELVEL